MAAEYFKDADAPPLGPVEDYEENVYFFDPYEPAKNEEVGWRKAKPPTLGHWKRVVEEAASNHHQLAEEMWATLRQLACFMRDLELASKERRIKKLTNTTGDWTKFCEGEERFTASLEAGMRSLNCLVKALKLRPMQKAQMPAAELYSRISRYEEYAKERGPREKIQELSFCLKEMIGRFAQICEAERVEHNLPITPEAPPSNIIPLTRRKPHEPQVSEQMPPPVAEVKKEPESNNIVYDFGDMIEREEPIRDPGEMQPTEFLWEYCRRDRSTPVYEDMGTVGKVWINPEFVVLCRLRNMSGEGKAKRKTVAKQCAAAVLIKNLMKKQRMEKLPADFRPLSEQETLLAVRVISEFLDFEKDLENVSSEVYHRMPIYTPLVNSSGNHVRCKALGYNAVGFGSSKVTARRMAAKLILDRYYEAKDLAKKKIKYKFENAKNPSTPIKSA